MKVAGQRHAAFTRQLDIDHNEIDMFARNDPLKTFSTGNRGDPVSMPLEKVSKH